MLKKIFFKFFLFVVIVLLSSKQILAENNDPHISISSPDNSAKGLLEFSSNEPVKIKVSSTKTSGIGKIIIYQANINDVLKYLTHDKDYKQTSPNIDLQNRTVVSTLENISFTTGYDQPEIEIPLDQSGIWIAQAQLDNYTDSTFILRNTYGAISKESKDNIVVWGQNFSDKRILKDALVKLYNLNGSVKTLGSGTLDGDGVASLPLVTEADLATVESKGETAIIPLNEIALNSYIWTSYLPNVVDKNYFSFTDRPIYKPGDTVYFKSIIRNDDDARYSIPSGSLIAEAYTGDGNNKTTIYRQTLNINNYGNIDGQFKIPENASTGYYTIGFKDNPQKEYNDGSIYFQVENYRKPESLIISNTKQNEVIRGDQLNFDITGKLFSGQPLPNINVTYKVYRSFAYDSEFYYETDSFYRAWSGDSIDTGTVLLDQQGHGKLTIPSDKYDSTGKDQIYTVEFSYVDATGNTATSANNFYIHSGLFSVYRANHGYQPSKINQEYTLNLSAKSVLGNNLSKFSADVKVTRQWWEKQINANQKYPDYKSLSENLPDLKINFDQKGDSKIVFTPSKPGNYTFTLQAKDSRDNLISKDFSVWVSENSTWYDNSSYNSSISIVSEKQSYLPGDTARFQINSSIPDQDIFLSIDRGYMDRYQIIHMNGKQSTVDIPLTDHDMPNIFVSVAAFNSTQLDSDVVNVAVSPEKMKLKISAITDKTKYGPGDEVTVNLTATDISGNPVSTNLALWAVDKSIFELSDKNYGDIFVNFWHDRYNDTVSSNSLQGILVNNAAEKGGCFLPDTLISLSNGTTKKISEVKVGDKIITKKNPGSTKLVVDTVKQIHTAKENSYLIINGKLRLTSDHIIFLNGNWHTAGSAQIGDTLIDQSSKPVKIYSIEWITGTTPVYNLTLDRYHTFFADNVWVHNDKGDGPRENFNDTAYWNPSINTDSNGKAQIRFKLPDNLTTWQIAVLGSSLDTKLGEAYTDIQVQKDLVIRPILPNVLRQGDILAMSAIIHNFTDLDKKVSVSLSSPDVEIKSGTHEITLPANSFQQVYWSAESKNIKNDATLTYSIKEKNGLSDTVIQKIDILPQGYWDKTFQSGKGSFTFDISLPEKFDSNSSLLNLDLSPSLLGSLTSSIDYLLDYPYGCTEQTTSRLVPIILAKQNPTLFKKYTPGKDLDKMISIGINRLKELQNPDGGWSWWYGDSDPFVTAYVAKNLSQLKQIGANVPENVINKTILYLKNIKNDQSISAISNQVLSNYGLLYLSPSGLSPIKTDLSGLTNDYLALAVITNIKLGETDPNSNGLNLLISRAMFEERTAYWTAGSIDKFGSIEASTALAIQALNLAKSDLSTQAITYLNNHRRGYWTNSFATVQSINSIIDYSVANKDTTPNYTYTVKVDGKTISSGTVNSADAKIPSINIDLNKNKNIQKITIEKNGSGEIYSNLTSKMFVLENQSSAISNGVKITREYVNAKGPGYNIAPGDLVYVKLNIDFDNDTDNNYYGIIEDHLPSGLIPVNTNLKNESIVTEGDYPHIQRNIEYTTDGALIPVYKFESGTYTYFARAIIAGDFVAPPASVSLMYNPIIFSRTEFSRLTVDDQSKKSLFATTNSNSKNDLTILGLIALIASPITVIFLTKKVIPYVKNKINRRRSAD